MKLLLTSALLLLFSNLTLLSLTAVDAKCHADDEAGLLGFKSGITADPSGILASWKPGTDCCTWSSVDCQNTNRVINLNLYGQPDKPNASFSGTISPSLSKLQSLSSIFIIYHPRLSGPFPDFIFGLPNLSSVYIENNNISGPIPESIGKLTQLVALSFEGNKLTGQITSSISQLTQLTQLKFGGNRLTGGIPAGVSQLKNLTVLSLGNNQLSGPIPDFFSSLTELRVLTLTSNKFTGGVPASISALAPNLRYLELGHNYLTGKIPDFLGKFQALDTLDLSWNKISGTVPKTFANLTKIFNLDLSHNLLVDPFPQLNVKGIESLDLSYNSFHLGTMPKWVTSSTIIYSLKLAKCGLKFRLDDWQPQETYFYDYIDLSDNEISGSPIGLLNKTELLVGFWASGNKLNFNLESLKIVKTLKTLDLSRNLVYGKVPKAVSGLQTLNLSNNHLCGPLPATKFAASAFAGNDCLCGSPLSPCK